jgi:DNA-binding LacI/PurR family transcriptional regulator
LTSFPNLLTLTCGDHAGGRQAAEHLFVRGHRDTALIGCTDTPRAAGLPTPLPTLRGQFRELGALVMHLLPALLEGEPCESSLLRSSLLSGKAATLRPASCHDQSTEDSHADKNAGNGTHTRARVSCRHMEL